MSGSTKVRACGLLSLAVIVGGASSPLSGQQATQAREHVVRLGDTLWGLAGFYYTNHFLWPVLFEANRDVVQDPHRIYPNQRLRIPGVEGGLPVAVEPSEAEPMIQQATGASPTGRTRFYRPAPPMNQEREFALVNRREPLFAVPPAEVVSAAWLADSAALGIRGRLSGLADPARQGDRMLARLLPHDRVLASWLRGGPAAAGDSLLVVRIEGRVAQLGNVVIPVALVRVDSVGATVMALEVVRQFAPARVGDFLIPVEPAPTMARGEAQPVAGGRQGRLVAFLSNEPLYGPQDHGFVDLGGEDGLAIGDELIAYVAARRGDRNTELPPEVVATLRVVKVRDASATVRVVDTFATVLRPGLTVQVVKRVQ